MYSGLPLREPGHASPVTAEPSGSGPLSISTIPKSRANGGVPDPVGPPPDQLVIRPRRGLPGSRSVVGGLLVAVAGLLTWWAAVGDDAPPAQSYVVAARTIGPGERITEDHLTMQSADLGPQLRRSAFRSTDSVVGSVAAGPIAAGELVQAGAVAPEEDPAPERELTFPVAATWAAGGDLRPGDRIDVYATYGEGTGSQTRRVLTDVRVRRIDAITSDRLGDTGEQRITVGLSEEVPFALVVNAVQSAEVTIARVTGDRAPARDDDGHDRFDAESGLGSEQVESDPAP